MQRLCCDATGVELVRAMLLFAIGFLVVAQCSQQTLSTSIAFGGRYQPGHASTTLSAQYAGARVVQYV